MESPTQSHPSPWQYAHLVMPMLTSASMTFLSTKIVPQPESAAALWASSGLLLMLSSIPTYVLGSLFYPSSKQALPLNQSLRFTRKSRYHRIAILFTYGRLYGTKLNIITFVADIFLSFWTDRLFGQRPNGAEPRRSEFFHAILWMAGSHVLTMLFPMGLPLLGFLSMSFDRTVWRMAYMALVDDVIGNLTRPNTKTWWGVSVVLLNQMFVILAVTLLAYATYRKRFHPQPNGTEKGPEEMSEKTTTEVPSCLRLQLSSSPTTEVSDKTGLQGSAVLFSEP